MMNCFNTWRHGGRLLFVSSFFLLLAVCLPGTDAWADSCEEITEEQAVKVSLENNPGLAAIQARYEALSALPDQAGALPDPVLSFGALNLPVDTFDLDQEGMTQMQLGISQKFPFPGKLDLKRQSASLEAEAARSQVEEAKLGLVKDVRRTWWDIFFLKKSLEIIRLNQDLLRATVASARTKYEVGRGLQQDVLLAQVELTRLLDREIAISKAISQKKATLAALMDRSLGAACFTVSMSMKEELPVVFPETQLQEQALSARPGLLALKKKGDAAKARVDLAKRDYFPDFTVGAAYGFRQDAPTGMKRPDFASFRLSMNLPVWAASKQSNAVIQRSRESLVVQRRIKQFQDRVQAEITSEYAAYKSAAGQCELYRTSLIPQAEQTAAAMLKGYQVNKVDFLNVVRAQLTLYNYKITYWKYFSNAWRAVAGLEAATGIPVYKEKSND